LRRDGKSVRKRSTAAEIAAWKQRKLDKVIEDLLQEGVDPIAPGGGLWFKFSRRGDGIQTEDFVDLEYETGHDAEGNKTPKFEATPRSPKRTAGMPIRCAGISSTSSPSSPETRWSG
jgi:hypothetical protein